MNVYEISIVVVEKRTRENNKKERRKFVVHHKKESNRMGERSYDVNMFVCIRSGVRVTRLIAFDVGE